MYTYINVDVYLRLNQHRAAARRAENVARPWQGGTTSKPMLFADSNTNIYSTSTHCMHQMYVWRTAASARTRFAAARLMDVGTNGLNSCNSFH